MKISFSNKTVNLSGFLISKISLIFFLALILSLLTALSVFAARKNYKSDYKFRTFFGNCPSRSSGTLAIKLIEEFEKKNSLLTVKRKIIKEDLVKKHFISNYKITYDPLKKIINLNFDCPRPLIKVQVYKDDSIDVYDAILVDNGQLYDPTYEILLRGENKLGHELSTLALPVSVVDSEIQKKIAFLIKNMDVDFRKKLSEVILNKSNELIIILSIKDNPSSVFIGDLDWDYKLQKLYKIIKYMEDHNKIPAIINLTNSKKVVVKFNNKF